MDQKYEGRGIVYAYVWHILEKPRIFLVPYEKAVELLPKRSMRFFQEHRKYTRTRLTDAFVAELEEYEDKFDVLWNAMLRTLPMNHITPSISIDENEIEMRCFCG